MNKVSLFIICFFIGFCLSAVGCCANANLNKETLSVASTTNNKSINDLDMKKINDSVVGFPKYDEESKELLGFYCTGFFVSEKYIATARHCVIDLDELMFIKEMMFDVGEEEVEKAFLEQVVKDKVSQVKEVQVVKHNDELEKDIFSYLETAKPIKTKVVYANARTIQKGFNPNDVIILEVLDKKDYSTTWLDITPNEPKQNEEVLTVSMINQNPWYLTRGFVAKVIHENVESNSTKVSIPISIMVNMTVFPGASGSPLINKYGQVVGLTSAVEAFSGNRQFMDLGNFVPSVFINLFVESLP